MTTARRTILIGSSALLVTALLTGCTLTSSDLGSLIPSSAPAALSDTATPTPTALAGDTNGDGKLSEFEKQILAKNAPKDYTLADGTVVSIDPTQPLPAAVVAEVRAAISPSTTSLAAASTGDGSILVSEQAILDALDAQAAAIGVGIAIVTRVASANPTPGGPELDGWIALASNPHFTGIMFTQDKSAMVTDVQAWAANRKFEFFLME